MRPYMLSTLLLALALQASAVTTTSSTTTTTPNPSTTPNNATSSTTTTTTTTVPPAPPINPDYQAQPGTVIIGGDGYCAGEGCGANRIDNKPINNTIDNNQSPIETHALPNEGRDAEQNLGREMEGMSGGHIGGGGGRR